jgi:phosphoglycolate phosphatase-like HAD superfamily hydrolase
MRLILFDVDGTLVLTGGAGVRAMRRAFTEVFGVADGLDEIPMAGRTDTWIVAQAAARHGLGVDADRLTRFHEIYVQHLSREVLLPGPRKGVLPGVRELLDRLSGIDNVCLGLLTGNFERGARIKLEHFDLWRYFPYGAFGDGERERTRLLPAAIARVEKRGGGAISPRDVVVVGDTPLDVAVAVAGGARSVAVATGSYTSDALRASGADAVLSDFSDLDRALAAIGLD